MTTAITYPETLSNDHTGREFLRGDLAETAEEAHAEIVRRLGLKPEEVAPIEGRVRVVPDSQAAYDYGYGAYYRPVRNGEQGVAEYWQTEAL